MCDSSNASCVCCYLYPRRRRRKQGAFAPMSICSPPSRSTHTQKSGKSIFRANIMKNRAFC